MIYYAIICYNMTYYDIKLRWAISASYRDSPLSLSELHSLEVGHLAKASNRCPRKSSEPKPECVSAPVSVRVRLSVGHSDMCDLLFRDPIHGHKYLILHYMIWYYFILNCIFLSPHILIHYITYYIIICDIITLLYCYIIVLIGVCIHTYV